MSKPGVGVPAKGDSSDSGQSSDPDATLVPLSDAPPSNAPLPETPVPDAHFDPDATMVDVDATMVDFKPTARPTPRPANRGASHFQASIPLLQPGDVLGGRYDIVQLLGEGGMGAVYKAMDRELDRPVALKLIRPELASNASMLARFKQELLLSRQVTHKNVIRIYDLGDADGVKFITMEFVEGQDLRSLIQEKKKFSPQEAVEIIEQVCLALEAAHGVGVIHRDLKPQNIMRDQAGRILVMDFGLARTLEGDGMTQSGALVGTMEYMSPEQALAQNLDQRSDLFTVGLILYELLTGVTPFHAESAIASLIKRTSQRAAPVSDHDQTIPGALSGIVSKCLERDPNLRYQTAADLLRDLEAWQGKRAAATLRFQPAVEPWGRTIQWPLYTGIATVLVLAIAAYVFRGPLFSGSAKKAAAAPSLSLAILPFRNASGDPAADWLGPSLAEMLSTDVGQSAQMHTVSPDRLNQVLSDLRVTPGTTIDPTLLGRIAEFSSADTVVWGQYAKFGDQIRIDATLQDLKHNRRVPLKIEAASEKDIPGSVDQLAELIRKNLSLSSDALKELKASSFQPSSKSVTALQDYNQGIQRLRQGKDLDAVQSFQAAVKDDPQFALAYSRLAEGDSALGYDNDAEQMSRRAVELSQDLPVAEKYLIEAIHARVLKDNQKAIAAYENLAKMLPDSTDVNYTLGELYLGQGDYDKARAHYAKVLQSDPKNLNALLYSGWLEVQAGNPQAGLDPLNRALNLAIAMDNQEEKAQILQAIGVAYEVLNKPDEALRNLQQAMDINKTLGKKSGVANSLNEIANVEGSEGKTDEALAKYKEAIAIDKEIGANKSVGDTLLNMGVLLEGKGRYDEALNLYKESLQVERDLGDEATQAQCQNNIANVYLAQGKSDDALTYYQQSLQLREKLGVPSDIAQTVHNLGEAYTRTAQYDNAMTSYMRALDLRRKAGDAKGADLETYGTGMVFLYQGRYGAALSSTQDAVKGFEGLKDRSEAMGEMLSGYAQALSLDGRPAEAAKPLEEAEGIAKELKNDSLMAAVLDSRGDARFYSGDMTGAKSAYQESLQDATKAKDSDKILAAKVALARVEVAKGQSGAATASLKQLIAQLDATGWKYLSLQASESAAQARIAAHDYAAAKQSLNQLLSTSEKLGLRMDAVKIQFLLAEVLRLSGNTAEAAGHYHQVTSQLDDMKKEAGADHLLDRADLKEMYADAGRWGSKTP